MSYTRSLFVASAILFLAASILANAPKRCDLALKSTPGHPGACLDLRVLEGAGGGVETAANATRIDRDGITLCKSAFTFQTEAAAEIVFIYDNSGSMLPSFAHVDPIARDTAFFTDFAVVNSGCISEELSGSLTYRTMEGMRTIPLLKSRAGCRNFSGDPYLARGAVIKSAIDFMARTSPTSIAGSVAFTNRTGHERRPLALDAPERVEMVKAAVILDTTGGTHYGPPLALAKRWLQEAALERTVRQAIVFISDGAPLDTVGSGNYLLAVDADMPPIYSIFLGRAGKADTSRLRQLSSLTSGTFTRVDPGNVAAIGNVMQGIIRSLLITTMPRSIAISNATLSPPQTSISVHLARNADSSVSVTLDSILALNQGVNDLRIRIVINDTAVREHTIRVAAVGPEAKASAGPLACFDPPLLTMLNASGYEDSAYAFGRKDYQVKVTRYSTDLTTLWVAARAMAAAQGPSANDDTEAFCLKLESAPSPTTVYRGPGAVEGGGASRTPNNLILEGMAEGTLLLTWVHPRDVRENAAYELPSWKAQAIRPFVHVDRVRDVSGGIAVNPPAGDPIVIRGGAEIRRLGPDSAVVTHRGCLFNCAAAKLGASDPALTPSFVFKTPAPFSFKVFVYDHMGQFVNASSGAVDAREWAAMPKVDDSVAVVMSFVPVSRDGKPLATGAYILRATIRTMAGEYPNGRGETVRVAAGSSTMLNRFGYLRN